MPIPFAACQRWLKARREDGRISGQPWPAAPTRSGRAMGRGLRGARAGCCARDAGPRCSASPRESARLSGAPAELRTAQVLIFPGLGAATYFYPSPPASSALVSPPPTTPGCQSTPSQRAAGGRTLRFGFHRRIFPFAFFIAWKEASFLQSGSRRSLASSRRKRTFPRVGGPSGGASS